jgi:hypothetical protein
MKITGVETLYCNAGWRNLSFLKITPMPGSSAGPNFPRTILAASSRP